jgi:hypothetical protein
MYLELLFLIHPVVFQYILGSYVVTQKGVVAAADLWLQYRLKVQVMRPLSLSWTCLLLQNYIVDTFAPRANP